MSILTMFKLMNRTSTIIRQLSNATRYISTYPEDSQEQVTVTDDGKVIVCWHPEKQFPYECSKPLPAEKPQSTWLFNTESDEVYGIFKAKNEHQMREELAKMTYTCKHRWYPRSRDRKAKKTRMNRPYL